MKKIVIVVAALILLQFVFVSVSDAAPPACGPVKYGYYQGYCGQHPYYGQRYYTNRAYYYQSYYPCCGYRTNYYPRPYYQPYTYYRAHYGYNYQCYHGGCYRH